MELQNMQVGQIVRLNFRTAALFKQRGIDFCCGGKLPLNEVITNQEELKEFTELLSQTMATEKAEHDFDQMDLNELIGFILDYHHEYIYREAKGLIELTDKVVNAHSAHHPELFEIQQIVYTIIQDLHDHQAKEERILFPYILELKQASARQLEKPHSCFGDIRNPIGMMEHEHENTGDLLMRMQQLTQNFTCPPEGCTSFHVLYKKLEELFENILQHVHLENNILHKKAIELQENY